MDSLLLTVDRASERLGVARTVLYSKLMSGEIVSVTVGRRRYIPLSAIEAYVAQLIKDQTDSEPYQVKVEA